MTYARLCDLAAQHCDPMTFALCVSLLTATALIAVPAAWQQWRGR